MTPAANNSTPVSQFLTATATLPCVKDYIEIGNSATWTLSSAKPGNGVDQLRDGSLETFWQSDGSQPHTVTLQFEKYHDIARIDLYTSHKIDESYTPQDISVGVGTSIEDIEEVARVSLRTPEGWVSVKLAPPPVPPSLDPTGVLTTECGNCTHVSGYVIQIIVLTNHLSGRDTHLRQVKVYSHRVKSNLSCALDNPLLPQIH
eukprot:GHVR01069080.1.p1 GENE.GHVR01069080.1~~GHVR01069080.1.p1  ORF type:complete len:212 (+),score=42.65 GHVR01069080.1:30-638(+)